MFVLRRTIKITSFRFDFKGPFFTNPISKRYLSAKLNGTLLCFTWHDICRSSWRHSFKSVTYPKDIPGLTLINAISEGKWPIHSFNSGAFILFDVCRPISLFQYWYYNSMVNGNKKVMRTWGDQIKHTGFDLIRQRILNPLPVLWICILLFFPI